MRQRTEYALLMLQQIGLPLLGSLASAPDASAEIGKESAALADLLRRSGEYGAHIGKSLDLAEGEEKNKPIRIALTALGAQAVALYRSQADKTPGDNEAKRFFSALEPVLVFSDSFVPGDEAIARLRGLSADFALFDSQQIQIQQLLAFLPVLQAVAAFSFGKPESKLVKEIGERLTAWAAAFRERFLGAGLDKDEARIADLIFVRMLASLYADCHRAQTERLMKLDESARGSAGLEPVWAAFEMRAAMLETLAGTFLPPKKQDTPASAPAEVSWDVSHPLPPAADEARDDQAGEGSARAAV